MPALYDLAFGYRNYEEEVEFLIEQHQLLHDGKAPQRVLELAAGPARHCLTALQQSYVPAATALDVSSEMKEYALELAEEALKDVTALEYVTADMTNFVLDTRFDSAWILLGSLQHLTTNEQVLSCLQCIHNVLEKDGTLIVELPHPREIFSLVECTRNGWEIPLEDEDGNTSGELKIVWGDDNDDFDPIRQVRQFTISMELIENDKDGDDDTKLTKSSRLGTIQSVREVVPMRHFTSQEMDVLARISGFEVVSLHGALARGVDVNDDDEAFRLVCVLQKKGKVVKSV
ncbi:type 11 methyltransferase [Nitzschia inconspicua]|uniref:Type 11 methyltransferase n=1 Tax=Nitzschia inconspicua TaxID=303405 RepID=A0A9K3PPB1_9STRA|nr:type 11 methyltransferase [Nitzschia inconspicua]